MPEDIRGLSVQLGAHALQQAARLGEVGRFSLQAMENHEQFSRHLAPTLGRKVGGGRVARP